MAIEYVVRCLCETPALSASLERWLVDEHFAEVRTAGATESTAVRFDDAPLVVEARYRFASREAFAAYERDHAPRLRAQGRTLFPEGVRFERRLGELLGRDS